MVLTSSINCIILFIAYSHIADHLYSSIIINKNLNWGWIRDLNYNYSTSIEQGDDFQYQFMEHYRGFHNHISQCLHHGSYDIVIWKCHSNMVNIYGISQNCPMVDVVHYAWQLTVWLERMLIKGLEPVHWVENKLTTHLSMSWHNLAPIWSG